MSSYLTPLLWSFVPSKATQILLPTLSSTFPTLLPPSPAGSPTWRRNYRLVLTSVIVLALVWNFAAEGRAERAGTQDWYALLGVDPRAGDDELRRAFRALSRVYHPDRLGPNAPREAEDRFILIRLAYETLSDPIKRFAYDRFGSDAALWQKIEGTREYVLRGAQASMGFYVGTVGLMLVLALLGRAQQGAYWRNVLLGIMLIWEITLILAPTPSVGAPASSEPLLLPLPRPLASIFGFLIPGSILRRPAYRHVATLHRLFASLSIAISQLAAEWGSPNDAPQRASQLATVVHGEALRELATTLQPILPHPADNDRKRAARKAIEDAVQAYPPFAGALADGLEFARRAAQKAAEEQQEGEKEGEGHDEKQKEKEEVTVAANIPLPPSRDGTPVGAAPRRRSARKASVPPS